LHVLLHTLLLRGLRALPLAFLRTVLRSVAVYSYTHVARATHTHGLRRTSFTFTVHAVAVCTAMVAVHAARTTHTARFAVWLPGCTPAVLTFTPRCDPLGSFTVCRSCVYLALVAVLVRCRLRLHLQFSRGLRTHVCIRSVHLDRSTHTYTHLRLHTKGSFRSGSLVCGCTVRFTGLRCTSHTPTTPHFTHTVTGLHSTYIFVWLRVHHRTFTHAVWFHV